MTLLVPGLLSTSPHKASSNCSRKGNQMMKTLKALTRLEKIGLGTEKTLENPSKLQEIIFHGERDYMNTKLWWEMCGHVVCLLLYLDQTNANCHSLFSHHSLWGFLTVFFVVEILWQREIKEYEPVVILLIWCGTICFWGYVMTQ